MTERDIHPSEVAQATATAKKLEAEASYLSVQAEREKVNVLISDVERRIYETRLLIAEEEFSQQKMATRTVQIQVDELQRKEKDMLSRDRYNHVYDFGEDVTDQKVRDCMAQLTTWSRNDGEKPLPITIRFNSFGGDMVEGMALFDVIRSLRKHGHIVTTYGVGVVASMAAILMQAGDKRVMGPLASMMIHKASFGTVGRWDEVMDRTEWIKGVQEKIKEIFVDRSNMSAAEFEDKWDRRNWWMSADEALDHGFIDEIE